MLVFHLQFLLILTHYVFDGTTYRFSNIFEFKDSNNAGIDAYNVVWGFIA